MLNIGIMPIWLGYILLFCGAFCIGLAICALCTELFNILKMGISELKYKHKRKHRFDKPPLAKCYCKDCEEWHNDKCWRLGRSTGDNWFCQDATPRKSDPDSQ